LDKASEDKFKPTSIETKALTKAFSEKKLDKITFRNYAKQKQRIEKIQKTLENDTKIKYPPVKLSPEIILDKEEEMVIWGKTTLSQEENHVFITVELSAPVLVEIKDQDLLSLMAHEFLHYTAHTRELVRQNEETNDDEQILLGVIPDEITDTVERDQYFYDDAETWFSSQDLITKVKEFDLGLKGSSQISDKLLEKASQGHLVKPHKRKNDFNNIYGEIWIDPDIKEKIK